MNIFVFVFVLNIAKVLWEIKITKLEENKIIKKQKKESQMGDLYNCDIAYLVCVWEIIQKEFKYELKLLY